MTRFNLVFRQATEGILETPLASVMKKELLHHEILQTMVQAGVMKDLTFVGGTSLRLCYGSPRFSEDLDFTGGSGFDAKRMESLPGALVDRFQARYGVVATIGLPKKETDGNVQTWKVVIQTSPEDPSIPHQHIHLDVAMTTSQTREWGVLKNNYSIDLGTDGLLIPIQTLEEIQADKVLAIGNRQKIKNRDLWDLAWMEQKSLGSWTGLLGTKLTERGIEPSAFLGEFKSRVMAIKDDPKIRAEFRKEMSRFLPSALFHRTAGDDRFWGFLVNLLDEKIPRLKTLTQGRSQNSQGWEF